jgi:hypothetical protein
VNQNIQNGRRNPNEPKENETIGGTAFGNKELVCNTVPSPPKVTTRSIDLDDPASSSNGKILEEFVVNFLNSLLSNTI